MAKADPEAKGAFVNCLVGGDSLEAAIEVLHSTLGVDGYELVSVGQISEFEVYRTKGNVSEEMEQEAGRIRREGGIWYSPFHCFRDASDGTPKDHEILFVANFIVPEKRQRWLEALTNEKKRNRFLVALADEGDLVVGSMDRITSGVELEKTHSLLLEAGAPALCWVISQWKSIDGQWMRLETALEKCLGIGLGTVLSFIPGKLCFFEAEMPGNRWLLRGK
jgi:hypothetical protein